MKEMKQDRVALDRAASSRTIDADGHMRVVQSAVSKANVCGYRGSEIPDAERLGLKADRIYQLYRDASALKAAADSLNGKPLLVVHKPQTADEHDHEIVVGALNNTKWDDPYLRADITIWDQAAIDLVTSGEQRQLSCAYRYVPIMEPGTAPDGTPYDGIMTQIGMNHCALVSEGRAGPDVHVGDSAIPLITIPDTDPATTPDKVPDPIPDATPEPSLATDKDLSQMAKRQAAMSRQALYASGAIRAYLLPKMAADAKLDITPALKDVTAKNWKTSKPKIKAALDKALAGKLAQDADLEDLLGLLDALEDVPEPEAADAEPDEDDDDEETKKRKAKEAAEKLKEAAADGDDDEDDAAMDAEKDNEDDEDDDKKKPAFLKDKKGAKDKGAKDKAKAMDSEPTVTKAAMDAAIAQAVRLASDSAAKAAEKATMTRLRSIAEAEKAVRPYIGELSVAMDSAAAVYRIALDAAGVDLTGVPEAAFPAMVKLLPVPGEAKPQAKTRVALDSAAVTARSAMFPDANRLSNRSH